MVTGHSPMRATVSGFHAGAHRQPQNDKERIAQAIRHGAGNSGQHGHGNQHHGSGKPGRRKAENMEHGATQRAERERSWQSSGRGRLAVK